MDGTRNAALQGRPRRAARRPARGPAGRSRWRGRVRRRPLLVGVAVVAVVSGVVVFARGARPAVDLLNAVPLERGYVGTTYAYDGLLCLGSQVTGTTVRSVRVRQAAGSTTALVRPPAGAPPTVGFPVAPADGPSVEGYAVGAGDSQCELRLLVTPTRTGTVRPGALRLSLGYGPGGLLRRTVTVTPAVTLDVTGTGRDPRLP